jgi:hypothetical protein
MNHAFRVGWHQFAVPVQHPAVGADDNDAVVERAAALLPISFIDAADDRHVMRAGGLTQFGQVAATDVNRVGEQACVQLAHDGAIPSCREPPYPGRVTRNERLGKDDQRRPRRCGFGDPLHGPCDGGAAIEQDRRALNDGDHRHGVFLGQAMPDMGSACA